ncbi:glycosyltransferase [Novipirellula sp. SH528]|uniref:glycosyltransferase n=1 Tax=Novipirellula sp. SH528 TaxID=3454466 RepID=UPI003F9FFBC1
MELHWLCHSPSPYNAQLFRAIAEMPDIDLSVHYQVAAVDSHPWKSQLTGGYNHRVYQLHAGMDWSLLGLGLHRTLDHRRRCFVIAGWSHPTAWALMLIIGLRRATYILWTDTPDLKRERRGAKQWLRGRFLRWAFGHAKYVMGTGKPALQALRKMGVSQSKLVNFPYWLDLDLYDASICGNVSSEADRKPVVFLSSGIIKNSRKGHDVAIRALAQAATLSNQSFEYRIAGAGPDEQQLRSLASELGLAEGVKFLGWLDPSRLLEELASADVLIHPSPVLEPYGVAVIEAMAAGLPVLGSSVTCAALDRIDDGFNGRIHRAGDVQQLASQIAELLMEKSLIRKMGQRALATAQKWPLSRAQKILDSLFH